MRDLIDDAGTLRKHTAYDSFGNVQGEQFFDDQGLEVAAGDPDAVDTLFGYTGRPFDDETQLQNNHHRWYDAGVGRWLSQNPIGFAGGDANLYRYVGNGSTGAVDPSGLVEPAVVRPGTTYFSPMIETGRQISDAAAMAQPLIEGTVLDAYWIAIKRHQSLEFCDESYSDEDFYADQLRFLDALETNVLFTLGGVGLGATFFRHGRFLGSTDEAAALANRLRNRSLESLSDDDHRFMLRYAMNMPVQREFTHVAHHLIPVSAISEFGDLLKSGAVGGFDLNGCENGMRIAKELHRSHPQYTEAVFSDLRKVARLAQRQRFSDEQIAAELKKVADAWRLVLDRETAAGNALR